LITIRDIMRARDRISRYVLWTPVILSDYLSDVTGATGPSSNLSASSG
jgi:threonine dehydratase